VIKRYHKPATPYDRALAHPMVTEAVKERLRAQYRTLDPVALLAEIRSAQEELGNRIDRRAESQCERLPLEKAMPSCADRRRSPLHSPEGLAMISRGEPRATHRRLKRGYKKRMRMPSKLDPHLALIESWLAAEPQLTAMAIVGRLADLHPVSSAGSSIRRCGVCCEPCATASRRN
jgi:hypothetical protein